MINSYFELMIWAHPDSEMFRLNTSCIMILRNLFEAPSFSTMNTDDSSNKKRRTRFIICPNVSMKFLRSLDIIKKFNIDENDKPRSQKFDRKDNRLYV
jgi:hypothetical protein